MSVSQAWEIVDQRFEAWIEELKTLVRIPSVSFPNFDHQALEDCAVAVKNLLEKSGFENCEVIHHKSPFPYVLGEYGKDESKPTVLLYAHHDVQPPMRKERWRCDPFDPTVHEGRLYGRGAADDKAGVLAHAASLAAWLESVGSCPVNLKVMIEGEEEIGSDHLDAFVLDHQERLKADALIVCDLTNFDTGLPSLTTSLRGMAGFKVSVRSTKAPLHSGMWSGPVPDPVMGLSKALASLIDEKGEPAVPDLDAEVIPLTEQEYQDIKSLDYQEALFRKQTGMVEGSEVTGSRNPWELIYRRPTITVTSIEAGAGGLAGNVIMDEAQARVSIRLAPGMDPKKSSDRVKAHFQKHLPWGLEVQFEDEPHGMPWLTNTEHPAFEAAKKSLGEGYGREAVFIGCGGSIPFVGQLCEVFGGIPALLTGLEDPYTLAHSENESLHLGDFKKCIRAQVMLFDELAKVL